MARRVASGTVLASGADCTTRPLLAGFRDAPSGGSPVQWEDRIDNYVRETRFPRSLFVSGDGRVVGTWIMGNDYRVKSSYYGGYPAGYLRRMAALFPDRRRVLHVFSGKVDLAAMPGDTVDCNAALDPTYVADAHDLRDVPLAEYDLVLADPPYSVEDAERYQTTMVKRNVVLRSLATGMRPGARVVWLDQVLPMYRKDEWAVEAVIGMVKSTNHRFRVSTVFLRLDRPPEAKKVAQRPSRSAPRTALETA